MLRAPAYPEERAKEVLRGWRGFMAAAPDEVSGLAEFSTIPRDPAYPEFAWERRVLSLATVYDGPSADGERATNSLLALGDPLVDFSDRMDYRTLQKLYDGLFPKGRDRCYWKSTYLAFDDEVIGDIVAGMAKRPSEMTYASVWKFGGAVQRVAADATAFGDRSMPYMLSIDGIWSRPSDDAANIAWVRNFWRGIRPLDRPTLPQLPRPRRRRRSRPRRFRRSSLRSSPGNQAQVRPNQSISHEPEH